MQRYRTAASWALKCVVGLVMMMASAPADAAVRYTVDRLVGSGRISGFIDTNGATGVLTSADLVDWDLVIDANGDSRTGRLVGTLSGGTSIVTVIGGALTATPPASSSTSRTRASACCRYDPQLLRLAAPRRGFHDEIIQEAPGIQAFQTQPPAQQSNFSASRIVFRRE
jgi:hypothetical protein